MNIVAIENLSVEYYRGKKVIPAVRGVSLNIKPGETLSLVGESGCGKSTLALSLLGLVAQSGGKITAGEIIFEGTDILLFSSTQWQTLRGKEIAMVFQDPFASLNPVMTVGDQIVEAIAAHAPGLSSGEKRESTRAALREVMFEDTERIFHSYPHQLSGGQRQRIAMAMAIVNRPKLLIADEPTTALDVTIQREILDLLDKLKKELSLTVVLITHNLPLASERSQKIAVMYAGEIVEEGTRDAIFNDPLHPYTRSLIRSIPNLHAKAPRAPALSGQPPDLSALPAGCSFAPRCAEVMDACRAGEIPFSTGNGRMVRCLLRGERGEGRK